MRGRAGHSYPVRVLLAVLQVDPQNDWVDYLNLVLAGVGGFAGAIAIVIVERHVRDRGGGGPALPRGSRRVAGGRVQAHRASS
ncbi:hypothetical protein Ade02nite_57590 [Paractinoplanes deccanensis]|uniref:Uncharacterized protein n=1 Tax=Paractinoplanes deccanensis TaxID=113561 RepID=A0ABQ3YAW4_9ACTN|nr:hypothetical protein Ade02nite_57590 [Actinoplanes deccanensis]